MYLLVSFCWSGHVFSSLWSIVSKVTSLLSVYRVLVPWYAHTSAWSSCWPEDIQFQTARGHWAKALGRAWPHSKCLVIYWSYLVPGQADQEQVIHWYNFFDIKGFELHPHLSPPCNVSLKSMQIFPQMSVASWRFWSKVNNVRTDPSRAPSPLPLPANTRWCPHPPFPVYNCTIVKSTWTNLTHHVSHICIVCSSHPGWIEENFFLFRSEWDVGMRRYFQFRGGWQVLGNGEKDATSEMWPCS